jgi:ATP-dependent RNA helicase DDX5/DBP2
MVFFLVSTGDTFLSLVQSLGNGYGGAGGGYGSGGWGGYNDRMSDLGGGLRAVDWSTAKVQRFEKNFYAEDKRVAARSDREIEDFRRAKEIKV